MKKKTNVTNGAIMAILLITALLLLCACGESKQSLTDASKSTPVSQESNKESKETAEPADETTDLSQNQEASIKTLGDLPVGSVIKGADLQTFTGDDLYLMYYYHDENGESKSRIQAVKQLDEDTYAMYLGDGIIPINEIVYEVETSTNSITKYTKGVFDEKYSVDTTVSKETLETEKNTILYLFGTFLMSNYKDSDFDFKKLEDAKSVMMSNPTYVFEILEEGKAGGKLYIDKETGVLIELEDADGSFAYQVGELKTEFDFPEYK